MKRRFNYLIFRSKQNIKIAYRFFNKFRLILFILLLFLLVYVIPFKLLPFLPISLDPQVSSQLLSAIISALASILAIALAIIFIGFEIMYKTFHTYVKKAFWEGEKFKELAILYVSTIIFSIFTLTILDGSVRSFNLITFNVFLSTICVIILFPYTKDLISGYLSTSDIKKLIDSLDVRHKDYLIRRVTSPKILSSYIEDKENDPLFILGEAAINYLKDNHAIRTYLIVVEVTKKFITEAEKSTDFRDLMKEYISFYRNVYRQALKTGNEGILVLVLDMIEEIHTFCAQKQKKWHEMIELNEMSEDLVSRSIKQGLEEVSTHALYMIPRIFEDHLKINIPKEEDIWDLNIVNGKPPEKTDYDASNHWRHVSDDYTRLQDQLARIAMREGLSHVTSVGIQGLHSMASITLLVNNLGDKQISDILHYLSYTSETLLIDCSKESFWESMVKISPFESFSITNCIDKNKPYSNILLIKAAELQLRLLKTGRLPIFELNDLGTTGRHCIYKIKQEGDIYEKSIEFLVLVFSEMRKILQKDPEESNYQLYAEIYKQANSLANWKGNKSKSLSDKISMMINKFTKIKKVEIELKKDTIEWPKSVENILKISVVN